MFCSLCTPEVKISSGTMSKCSIVLFLTKSNYSNKNKDQFILFKCRPPPCFNNNNYKASIFIAILLVAR